MIFELEILGGSNLLSGRYSKIMQESATIIYILEHLGSLFVQIFLVVVKQWMLMLRLNLDDERNILTLENN